MTTAVAAAPVAERAAPDAFDIHRAAEQILFTLKSSRDLTSVQVEILRQAGFENVHAIERELGRIEQVKIWMQRAGTAADLLDAEKQTIEAARVHREQAPEIQAKIDELQAELAELNSARDAAAKRFNDYTIARERLRQVAPRFARHAAEFDRQAAMHPHSARIREIKGALHVIQQLEQIEPTSQQAELHFEAIGRARGLKQNYRGVDPVLWNAYVKGRVSERAQLERELAQLQAKCRQAVEAASDGLDYYIKRLG